MRGALLPAHGREGAAGAELRTGRGLPDILQLRCKYYDAVTKQDSLVLGAAIPG